MEVSRIWFLNHHYSNPKWLLMVKTSTITNPRPVYSVNIPKSLSIIQNIENRACNQAWLDKYGWCGTQENQISTFFKNIMILEVCIFLHLFLAMEAGPDLASPFLGCRINIKGGKSERLYKQGFEHLFIRIAGNWWICWRFVSLWKMFADKAKLAVTTWHVGKCQLCLKCKKCGQVKEQRVLC